jgi:hypothetical protein
MKIRKLRGRVYRKKGGPRGLGNRCKEYYEGCIVCDSYKVYDETGRFPSYEELRYEPTETHTPG